MPHSPRRSAGLHLGAFTLVEVLVSTVLIVAIMVLLLGTVDQTQRLWARSRSKATQFQSARAAFEVIARRMSQATLNTYWRAADRDVNTNKASLTFRRQSELQFLSGPMERILDAKTTVPNLNGGTGDIADHYPTHGVFFTVPLGTTEYIDTRVPEPVRQFRSLDSMLVACGYFIEFGDDPDIPLFVRELEPKLPPRFRYRLMELTVPAEKFNVFYRPTNDLRLNNDPRIFDEDKTFYDAFTQTNRQLSPKASFARPLWMVEAFDRVSLSSTGTNYRFKYARPIAENVVAMIILPKLAVKDRVRIGSRPPVPDPDALELAPQFGFDSWRVLGGKVEMNTTLQPPVLVDNRARDNLLPPTVQVTMVAIDELSAQRMALTDESEKPKWIEGLFRRATSDREITEDLWQLEKAIRNDAEFPNMNYRIFTTDVVIRGSKWSRDPNL